MNTRTRKRRDRSDRDRTQRLSLPQMPCSICGKLISNICAALTKEGDPVHFDCAIQDASEQMEIKAGEKVIYLGNGMMAAVEESLYRQEKLKIIRSMSWEPKDVGKPAWRGEISKKVI